MVTSQHFADHFAEHILFEVMISSWRGQFSATNTVHFPQQWRMLELKEAQLKKKLFFFKLNPKEYITSHQETTRVCL